MKVLEIIAEEDLISNGSSNIYHNTRNHSHLFHKNTKRKNFFLATCKSIQSDVDLEMIDLLCPFGGLIGIGNSPLENVLGNFKIFRLHAIFHDAAGFMLTNMGCGPGYCYILPSSIARKLNYCFLGHLTGLSYCLFLKLFHPHIYFLFSI